MLHSLIAHSLLAPTLALMSALVVSDDPEAVITTAPGGVAAVAVDAVAPVATASPSVSLESTVPNGLSTSEQIQRWVGAQAGSRAGSRGETARPFASDRDPFAFRDDRKMHGEVSVGIGTGDYSAFAARVSIPVGENGRVDLSYSQSKNSPWGYGYGYGGLGGFDPRFGPGYRGHYDPFFIGEGVVTPSRFRAWRQRDGLVTEASGSDSSDTSVAVRFSSGD